MKIVKQIQMKIVICTAVIKSMYTAWACFRNGNLIVEAYYEPRRDKFCCGVCEQQRRRAAAHSRGLISASVLVF